MKKILTLALIAILSLISIAIYATILECNTPYVEQCPNCLKFYNFPPEYVGGNTWRYTCAYCGSHHDIKAEEPRDTTCSLAVQQPTINPAQQ